MRRTRPWRTSAARLGRARGSTVSTIGSAQLAHALFCNEPLAKKGTQPPDPPCWVAGSGEGLRRDGGDEPTPRVRWPRRPCACANDSWCLPVRPLQHRHHKDSSGSTGPLGGHRVKSSRWYLPLRSATSGRVMRTVSRRLGALIIVPIVAAALAIGVGPSASAEQLHRTTPTGCSRPSRAPRQPGWPCP